MKQTERTLHVSFHKRMFVVGTSLFAIFLLGAIFIQYSRETAFRKEQLNDVLQSYNYAILHSIEADSSKLAVVGPILQELTKDEMRVTVMDPRGNVLYDTFDDLDAIDDTLTDNHLLRPEVQAAIEHGEGYSQRVSESLDMHFFYAAQSDGRYIVRCAIPYGRATISYMQIDSYLMAFFVLMTIVFVSAIAVYSARLGRAITALRDFSAKAERNELGEVTAKLPANELGDIAGHIIRLYVNLDHTREELTLEKDKLLKHLQISNEGLAVFSPDRRAVVTNPLFIQYINTIADTELSTAEGVFELKEFEPIVAFLGESQTFGTNNDRTKQILVDKNGKTFTVTCALSSDLSFEININNITRQEQEARLKRQLTQNVAHELKTPVSSIRGFVETLIENPDLDAATRRQFLDRCNAQATRLTDLLKDISMLNRIDEAADSFEREPIDVGKMVREMADDSRMALSERGMTVSVEIPSHTIVRGNQLLLYSIFRNLLDNAIAYAGANTHVAIRCYRQDAEALYFSFSDTGTGVDEHHLNRLFERFYRLDKGRSRKLGGTGLGLAIVKNAVLYHKGEIVVKNRPEGGLEFLFSIKRG